MTKAARRAIRLCILALVLALAAGAFVVFGGRFAGSLPQPLNEARLAAANGLLDASGMKARIEEDLRTRASELAEQTRLPLKAVEGAIDGLAIAQWQVTDLPEGTEASGSFTVEPHGVPTTVTLYDRNDVVSAEAYGQTVHFAVPEQAQPYLALVNLII